VIARQKTGGVCVGSWKNFKNCFKGVFMKNVIKAFGLIALVAIIGFSMAACNDNSGPTGGINGTWQNSNGMQVNISGSSGTIRVMGSLSPLGANAVNKGYVSVGSKYWQNIKSTGNSTWSGEQILILYNTSSPGVATGTTYVSSTFSLSYDGQTLYVYYSDSSSSNSVTWYRYK